MKNLEEVVEEVATEIHFEFPKWFADAVKEFSDEECVAIVESLYDTQCTVLWETLTGELKKQREGRK
jgi:hypothetical protein